MKKEVLVIYDEDAEYVHAFSEYVNTMSNAAFSAVAFTDLDDMLKHISERKVSLILLPERLLCAEILSLNIQIMLLSDDESEENKYEFSEVWKYQSGDNIIREVTGYYSECKGFNSNISNTIKKLPKIYGVFSPACESVATIFSTSISQILGENNRVLYIDLEEFSGLQKLFDYGDESDLSEIMYFYMEGSHDMSLKLKWVVRTFANFDYIPPMVFAEDIRNIRMETWCKFVESIGQWSEYDVVILCMTSMLHNVMDMIRICDKLFVPYDNSFMSKLKVEEFEKYISDAGYADYNEKIRTFKFDSALSGVHSNESLLYGKHMEDVKKIAWDVMKNE